jgi:hypothetical protein
MPYIGSSPSQVAFLVDTFSGNGSTTAFTTSVAPANTASVLVAISGVLQDPSTYSVSGTTLTFSAAPPTGTGNISARYLGIPASGVTTTAYRTVTNFTATSGQTTFTPPSYTVGFINVYRNGVLLGTADYTASNGTTVVLATGATAGDLIITESFYVSSVLNAIPATAGSIGQTYLAAGVAGTGPAFSAYLNSTQSFTGSFSKVQCNVKEFDTASCYDATTNYRFTPTVAGYYQVSGCWTAASTGSNLSITIYKNGSDFKRGQNIQASAAVVTVCALVYLNGSTDYVELYAASSATQNANTGANFTYFQAAMVRSA